jgi:hypothetical protein
MEKVLTKVRELELTWEGDFLDLEPDSNWQPGELREHLSALKWNETGHDGGVDGCSVFGPAYQSKL